jgi:urease accessory protein
MVIEKICGNLRDDSDTHPGREDKNHDYVHFSWYEVGKRHMKKISERGEAVGISLEHGLRDGDILYEDEQTIISAKAEPVDLLVAVAKTPALLARVCYELGNRHLPVIIGEEGVVTPWEEPLAAHLTAQGFEVLKEKGCFEGFIGGGAAHGHG